MSQLKVAAMLFLAGTLPGTAFAQQTITIDLGASTQTVSQNGIAGQNYRFVLANVIPGKNYEVQVELKVIPIPAFAAPEIELAGFAAGECQAALKIAAGLSKAASEADIKTAVATIEKAMAGNTCDPKSLSELSKAVQSTGATVSGTYPLSQGTQLIVTVSRGDKKWMLTISGGERGTWLTTYGVVLVPNLNERAYLLKDGDTFTVTDVGKEKGVVPVASILFHWLPASAANKNWSFGLSGGLGLANSRAALMIGGSLAYNWNLVVFAGLAASPHSVRRGEYALGRTLTDDLTDDQLNQKQWKPSFAFGVTFRFAGNPFKK